jgi:hypothetical protein
MTNLTLVKLESLCLEVNQLISGELVEQKVYENLIHTVNKIETVIKLNLDFYKADGEKMILICKNIIFNLMIKIVELIKVNQ